MPRGPSIFRQRDVTRALRAVQAAGLQVIGCEIDPMTGKIMVSTSDGPEQKPATDLDKWMANHAG